MILDRIDQADRYARLHPLFAKAFAFLRRPDLAGLPSGRHEIDGDRVYAIIARDDARSREAAPLEVHRRYIDIQAPLATVEQMGWRALGQCQRPGAEFDAARDLGFFADAPSAWVAVSPGEMAVFFPADAHAPLVGVGSMHKAIVKVAVAGA